ncbi:autotransporter outer membrane beta-barrel domain-containing protein [Lysobacter panacisoli]|uniref:Autotransporter domain-containing protein n=1 Tax=Lysobacter panacisoli TaxID=1255263 RepID=A0ABP9LFU4_9GAMM|nr:autotransporter outer membrane beta-barrel domain-containing protein [Lysobacter panacisoli]
MNKIYRIVWSQALRTWVVVSELTAARGKSASGRRVAGGALALVLSSALLQAHAVTVIPDTPSGVTPFTLSPTADNTYLLGAGTSYVDTAGNGIVAPTGTAWTFTNNGTIGGSAIGLLVQGSNSNIFNNGIVNSGTSGISLSGAANTTVTLGTGSQFNPAGGTALLTTGNTNRLVLTGTGSENDNFGGTLNSGWASLNSTAGSVWTLGGNVTTATGGAGQVQVSGDLTLNGAVQGNGGSAVTTTVNNGGTLRLGSGGTTGSVNGSIANNGSLIVNRDGNLTLGVITGTGTLEKAGSGTTTLSAGTNYSGATTVSGGTLNVSFVDALRNSSSVHVAAGATLQGAPAVSGIFSTVNNLSGDAGSQVVGFDSLNLVNDRDTTFAGSVTSGGVTVGTVQKLGSGTLTLTSNSPQLWRAANVLGGTLEVADGGQLKTGAGGVNIKNATGDATMRVRDGGSLSTTGVYVDRGQLQVLQGGATTATALRVGSAMGDSGSITVADGGRLSMTSPLFDGRIGVSGTGTLDVQRGGVVETIGSVNVGLNAGSSGTATIDGAGSTWTSAGQTTIGNSGTGFVTVDHDATMQASRVVLGNNAGSVGSLGLLNGGTLTTGQVAAGAGTASFAMDDGVLRASAASTDFISGLVNGVNLLSGGGTIDSNGFDVASSSSVTGVGALDKAGAGTLTLNAASDYSGGSNVHAGTLAITRSDALGSGTATVDSGATLAVAPTTAGDFTFNNALAGSGLFTVGLVDTTNAFAFSDASGGFAGTAQLGNSRFDLSGTNTAALANATLQLDAGNTTTVGTGTQTIGGLNLNGGRVVFPGVRVPGSASADASIAVGDLALNGGEIALDLASSGLVNHPTPSGDANLLSQDDDVQLQLIAANGAVTGSGSNLAFIDATTQQPISNALQTNVIEGGNVVAVADHDFIFNTVDAAGQQGLFVGYGLRQLNVQDGQTLTLAPDAGATGLDTDLAAKVTGTGHLAIDAGANLVSLSNSANDYTGETHVQTGTLRMDNDHVLGATSLLDVATGASADLNGHSQTVGKLVTQAGSHLQLDGALTISDAQRTSGDPLGGTIEANTLAGSGTLTLDPSIVEVNGANAAYTGNVDVIDGSQLILNDVQGVGDTGTITLAAGGDRLTLGNVTAAPGTSPNGTLAKQLAGAGTVALRDSANVTLSGDNSAFAGDFDIASGTTLAASQPTHLGSATIANAGTMNLTADSDWSLDNTVTGDGTLVKLGGATLSVDQALAGFTGPTQVDAGTLQLAANGAMAGDARIASGAQLTALDGAFVHGTVDNAGTLTANAGNATVGALNNAGLVRLGGASVGNTLTVAGNYTGQGGTVQINTVLDGDNSLTDRLIVQGDTAGSSKLHVDAVSGTGAYSNADGIQVVRVDGQSNGTFGLDGRVVAGAFEYDLYHGGKADPNDGDWYLRSDAPVVVTPPDTSGTPGTPDSGGTPGTGGTPAPLGPQRLRPEVGAYLGNQYMAGTMLKQTLRDRAGELAFVEGRQDGGFAGWARVQRDEMQSGVSRNGVKQLDVRGDSSVVQVGAETVRHPGEGRLHVGLMGSHGEADTHSQSDVSGRQTEGRVSGNAIGAYGTWFAKANSAPGESTGLYVDGWAQFGRFDNKVHGEGLPTESYNADSWSASLEAGYGLAVHRGEHSTVYLEPQVQAIYSDYSADDHVEANLTRVDGTDSNGLTTRVGARLYGRTDAGAGKRVQPFVEANWWHNGYHDGVAFDGVRTSLDRSSNVYEIKAGAEADLGSKWTGWFNLGVQQGSDDDRGVTGMLGIRKGW